MNQAKLEVLLKEMQALPKECEWAEFKVYNLKPYEIGEYISALSNSACYRQQSYAYLVFGIENLTHSLVGTKFQPKHEKKGAEEKPVAPNQPVNSPTT